MSSLKHIIPKKSYRERGQAKHRLHLGELEKKVDYEKRRSIYKKKQKIENVLKEKIMTKNPDEFHTGMVHSRIKDKDNVLIKEGKVYNSKKQITYKRGELKNNLNILYNKLKKVNKKIYNYQMNIPFRYVFDNTHEIYEENDKKQILKPENGELIKKAKEMQEEYNNLIYKKQAILRTINKVDNKYVNTYRDVDGFKIEMEKPFSTYRMIAPRLK
ncbi:nucleolar rRNA processing protein, putative [Hepatocystis sp. ex Piliocolobus tephrosceles]|nr:nucleolar rRNA processing protein, putative [Hepatocystis sp. ex Piliocolobus tephrosceles]